MEQNREGVLAADDPHLLLLEKMQQEGAKGIKDMTKTDLYSFIEKLTPCETNYVKVMVRLANRSVWQHIKDEIESFSLDFCLPDWLASRI